MPYSQHGRGRREVELWHCLLFVNRAIDGLWSRERRLVSLIKGAQQSGPACPPQGVGSATRDVGHEMK